MPKSWQYTKLYSVAVDDDGDDDNGGNDGNRDDGDGDDDGGGSNNRKVVDNSSTRLGNSPEIATKYFFPYSHKFYLVVVFGVVSENTLMKRLSTKEMVLMVELVERLWVLEEM